VSAGAFVALALVLTTGEVETAGDLTHWISREKALVHLRAAHSIAPESSHATYFLADALLNLSPSSRDEAVRLLQSCASRRARPEYLVEDAHYAEMARERLAGLH
jgi:hypothetical protein